METIFQKIGGTYHQKGDCLLPKLTVPDEHYNIGKYGMLRRSYLKNHRRALYTVMMMNGTLLQHLAEIDKTCHDMLDRLMPQMAEHEGVTEALKAADPMEWVRRMNSIKSRIEEILYNDYVYAN